MVWRIAGSLEAKGIVAKTLATPEGVEPPTLRSEV